MAARERQRSRESDRDGARSHRQRVAVPLDGVEFETPDSPEPLVVPLALVPVVVELEPGAPIALVLPLVPELVSVLAAVLPLVPPVPLVPAVAEVASGVLVVVLLLPMVVVLFVAGVALDPVVESAASCLVHAPSDTAATRASAAQEVRDAFMGNSLRIIRKFARAA